MTSTTRPNDRYPTRLAAPVQSPRHDPVVWVSDCAGPLDPQTLAVYDRKGFLEFEGLFKPEEVALYLAEVERLQSDAEVLANERTVVEEFSGQLRSIFQVHSLSSIFATLFTDPRLLDCARQILGSEAYIHQSRINLKPGFGAAGFYWHSDFETWHAEDGMPAPRALSFSIALTENLPVNGPLMIIPGSHRTFLGCEGETPPDHFRSSLRRQEIGTPARTTLAELVSGRGIDQVTGRAGTATVFDSNCMHGSSDNITPYPRCNIFLVYNSVNNILEEPFSATARRPDFIASREFTPIHAQPAL